MIDMLTVEIIMALMGIGAYSCIKVFERLPKTWSKYRESKSGIPSSFDFIDGVEVTQMPAPQLQNRFDEAYEQKLLDSTRRVLQAMVLTNHPLCLWIKFERGESKVMLLTSSKTKNELKVAVSHLTNTLRANMSSVEIQPLSPKEISEIRGYIPTIQNKEPEKRLFRRILSKLRTPFNPTIEKLKKLRKLRHPLKLLKRKSKAEREAEEEVEAVKPHVAVITGEPIQTHANLSSLAEYFMQIKSDEGQAVGEYIALALPVRLSKHEIGKLRDQYADLTERMFSEQTVQSGMYPSWSMRVKRYDRMTQEKLARVERGLKRHEGPKPTAVYVFVVGGDKVVAEEAGALMSGSGWSEGFKDEAPRLVDVNFLDVKKSQEVIRDLANFKVDEKFRSILTAFEASTFFYIPPSAVNPTYTKPFDAPSKKMQGDIELGDIMRGGYRTNAKCAFHADNLPKHTFITGSTGKGKTVTTMKILVQLKKHGVPFLVIEPSLKAEYHQLASVVQDNKKVFAVFHGLGEEQTGGHDTFIGGKSEGQLRMNMFVFPQNISRQTHIDLLNAVLRRSFPMWQPLPFIYAEALRRTYEEYKTPSQPEKPKQRTLTPSPEKEEQKKTVEKLVNVGGRDAPSLDFFIEMLLEVVNDAKYDDETKGRIRGAINTRITALKNPQKRELFCSAHPIEDEWLFTNNIVVQLNDLGDDEDKALVCGILFMKLIEHRLSLGQYTPELQHITLLEEAHRLLGETSAVVTDYDQDLAQKASAHTLANMISEMRAFGEGIIIVDQMPSRIVPEIIKGTSTKIIHNLQGEDDRQKIANIMGLTDEQKTAIGSLKTGEAVIWLEEYPYPFLVHVDAGEVKLKRTEGAKVDLVKLVEESEGKRFDLRAFIRGIKEAVREKWIEEKREEAERNGETSPLKTVEIDEAKVKSKVDSIINDFLAKHPDLKGKVEALKAEEEKGEGEKNGV